MEVEGVQMNSQNEFDIMADFEKEVPVDRLFYKSFFTELIEGCDYCKSRTPDQMYCFSD